MAPSCDWNMTASHHAGSPAAEACVAVPSSDHRRPRPDRRINQPLLCRTLYPACAERGLCRGWIYHSVLLTCFPVVLFCAVCSYFFMFAAPVRFQVRRRGQGLRTSGPGSDRTCPSASVQRETVSSSLPICTLDSRSRAAHNSFRSARKRMASGGGWQWTCRRLAAA